MVQPPVTVSVPARAGLVGNPSDLSGGAVLAVPVTAFSARVAVSDAPATRVDGPAEGLALVTAAMARLPSSSPVSVRWTTDIPHTVGLAGSSAIVIAVLRAMAERTGRPLADGELAHLALEIEADELGIVAGIQDRAVQAAGTPVLVDVGSGEPVVTALTPARPLRVVVAWSPEASGASGDYRRALRDSPGDLRAGMGELGRLARTAAVAFQDGDATGLAGLMAESSAVRAEVAPLPPGHVALADAVAATGLRPNSAGSGGAVAAVVTDDNQLARLPAALAPLAAQYVVATFG